jgi:hypothetical protein
LLERLEDLRQEAIARLDELQGDPDLEPSLAGVTGGMAWGGGNTDDREGDDEREADPADAEPALGAPEGGPGGCRWGGRYWQASDEEEPSLGWSQTMDQEPLTLTLGTGDGREEACEGEGDQSEGEGEPEFELCGWRTGDVDQTLGGAVGAASYQDRGDLLPWWAP